MKPFDGKRLAALALGALLCLCQAGCSFTGLDAQNLMSPPRANLEQQGIYELLQEGDSQELTFVYPKRGENRSAIIMKDWTGDGVSDAVGFVSTEGGGVRVSFLEKYQERWRTAASFVNAATQVDLVTFGDVNGDGAQDVLIGWGSAAGTTGRTAAVSAYLYRDGDVTETLLGTYGEMAVTDLDGDGVSEVFTVDKYVAAEEEGAEALPPRPTSTPGRTAPCRSCTPPARTTPSPATRPSTSASWAGTSPPWWWTAPRPTAA